MIQTYLKCCEAPVGHFGEPCSPDGTWPALYEVAYRGAADQVRFVCPAHLVVRIRHAVLVSTTPISVSVKAE